MNIIKNWLIKNEIESGPFIFTIKLQICGLLLIFFLGKGLGQLFDIVKEAAIPLFLIQEETSCAVFYNMITFMFNAGDMCIK